MDASPVTDTISGYIWLLLVVGLVITFLRSAHIKGWLGEATVRATARLRLSIDTYYPFHDVTLTTPGGTTQIDHVFVSRFGIFVVETKHMSGWIFGGENQSRWTQKFRKKSFQFQNPLRQNYKHLKAVEAVTRLPIGMIHSVVVFTGDSHFKTAMPSNVTQGGGFVRYIKSFQELVLTVEQMQSAVASIQTGRLAPTRETSLQHVQQLKQRSNPYAERKCPACGSKMVLRTATKGVNAGGRFWGCSSYPKCRAMQKFD